MDVPLENEARKIELSHMLPGEYPERTGAEDDLTSIPLSEGQVHEVYQLIPEVSCVGHFSDARTSSGRICPLILPVRPIMSSAARNWEIS